MTDQSEVLGLDDRDTGMCDYCGTEEGRRRQTVVTARFDGTSRRCAAWLCGECRVKALRVKALPDRGQARTLDAVIADASPEVLAAKAVFDEAHQRRTKCGFCDDGIYRDGPCPYCDGTGTAS